MKKIFLPPKISADATNKPGSKSVLEACLSLFLPHFWVVDVGSFLSGRLLSFSRDEKTFLTTADDDRFRLALFCSAGKPARLFEIPWDRKGLTFWLDSERQVIYLMSFSNLTGKLHRAQRTFFPAQKVCFGKGEIYVQKTLKLRMLSNLGDFPWDESIENELGSSEEGMIIVVRSNGIAERFTKIEFGPKWIFIHSKLRIVATLQINKKYRRPAETRNIFQ